MIPHPDLTEALLSRFSDFVAARLGLHFPRERWGDLERRIDAATRELASTNARECIERLMAGPLTVPELGALAAHLTVGETYFFREPRAFDALRERILPELIHASRGGQRRLRIWSAGCCSGEEPYSIAMLLDQLLPDARRSQVTLLATDVNPRHLDKATAGVYGEWSFRETPARVRERYFKRSKHGRFEIRPELRDRVTFSHLNLADAPYPSNTQAMDLILCRNVLMYFTPTQAKKVVENMYRSLADGGWLVVGPAETSNVLFSAFTAVEFPGVILYRKVAGARERAMATGYPAAAPADWLPIALHPPVPVQSLAPAIAVAAPGVPLARTPTAPGKTLPADREDREAPALRARACADQGRLEEATDWCERAITADKLNPAHHYLLATIRQEQRDIGAAAQALRRALYLEPGFVLAHFALGSLHLEQGRPREAERYFTNTVVLLGARPRDEILPESDGVTAGRLGEIVASIMASLPRGMSA